MTDPATGDSPFLVARSAPARGAAGGVESVGDADHVAGAERAELVAGLERAESAVRADPAAAHGEASPGASFSGASFSGADGAQVASAAPRDRTASPEADEGTNSRLGLVALLASVVAIAWFLIVIARDVEAARFTRLDLRAVRVDSGPGWVDPRWGPALEQALAALPEMDADDPATLEIVRQTLAALPFVAEVGEVRVLWPDGVRLQVRWREPVACVRTGDGFALVSSEGVVLPGEWSAPPGRAYGYYPLIGAGEIARAELEIGAWLQDERWLDGLSVARVLGKGLQPDDWIRLGRIVIDTRESRAASVEHPGVVLWFEGGRRAYFGRAPHLDEPGELPVTRKCLSLSLALRRLDEGPEQLDWELVDLRWDQPELLPRGGLPDATGVAR
jgi:hypothetical protein